jgi:hypothetical protein
MSMLNEWKAAFAAAIAAPACVNAGIVQVRVTFENLSGANGAALSPLTVGFHDGGYDAFNNAAPATGTGTQLIAEGGDGSLFQSSLAATQSSAVSGSIIATSNGFGPGILLPGGSGSAVFTLDTTNNRYFSFGAMVVPSNDFFIGNDNPTGIELFNASGDFVGSTITLSGSNIWEAGTEVNGPFGAAFLDGQNGAEHIAENLVVGATADFAPFAGLLTAAGYTFSNTPSANADLARISFAVVPTPSAAALLGFAGIACGARRRRA